MPEAGPLKLVRAPKINRTINHNVIMELLWSSEYKKMASVIAGHQLNLTSFNQFEICKGIISSLPDKELNKLFIEMMKKRPKPGTIPMTAHKELNQIFIAMKVSKAERSDVLSILKSTIS